MDADLRQRVALFRYSLIAPLVTGTYTQATAREYVLPSLYTRSL